MPKTLKKNKKPIFALNWKGQAMKFFKFYC